MHRNKRGIVNALALLALLSLGAWLRFRPAGENPLWVDEAESSINALTILEHGYPVSTYLGAPIYENTLVKPWPESPEFEFRDSSYSDKGLAIYHGWFPLYAIAASFRLHGIEPDRNDGILQVRHRGEELRRRTWAARLPALLFSLVLLIAIFFAGRDMGPFPAGWLALLFAAVTPTVISYGQQARYYSSTIALSILTVHALWALAVRQKWINVAAAWLTMTLLFHTHLITFATAALVMMVASVLLVRTREGTLKAVVLWLAIGVSCLPWLLGSGFLTATREIPAGWTFLELPSDIVAPLLARPRDLVLVLIPLILFAPAVRKQVQSIANRPGQSVAVLLLLVWIATGYLAFYALMPAASQFSNRMMLSFISPCLLLQAIGLAAVIQMISNRSGIAAGVALLGLTVWQVGRVRDIPGWDSARITGFQHLDMLVAHLDKMKFGPGTKLYSTPNHHLIMTFYTGLPVVSVAPVRKSFLDEYPLPVVLFEPIRYLGERRVREALEKAAEKIAGREKAEVREWIPIVQTYPLRTRLSKVAAEVIPPLEIIPDFARRAVNDDLRKPIPERGNLRLPMLRGFERPDSTFWWGLFMYRFVEPHKRIGDNLNYRDRMRNATAELIADGHFVVYQSLRPPGTSRSGMAGR